MGYGNTNNEIIQIDNKSLQDEIGLLSDLKTTDKSSLVNATNEITSQLADISANLSDQDSQTSTIQHGLNVITTDQASPTDVRMYGRTLVNLLGKDGNFEKQWDVNATVDTSTYKFGSASGKIDNSAGTTEKFAYNPQNLKLSGKRILIGCWVKSVSGNPNVDLYVLGYDSSDNITDANRMVSNVQVSNQWKFYYKKFDLTASPESYWKARIDVNTFGTADDVVNFDGFVVYEISQDIYDKIDVDAAYTGDALATKFPYVDSVQHSMNPFVKNSGKNLIPPFTSDKCSLHANAKVISEYELELDATANDQPSTVKFDALPNQSYVFSISTSGNYAVQALDKNGAFISTVTGGGYVTGDYTFTTPSNTKYLNIILSNYGLNAGTFTFTNPQLELGSAATSFEPQNESYLYVAQDESKNPISLASNNDGSVADEVYQRDSQWYRLNRFKRDMVLDGSLAWGLTGDNTGYKMVQLNGYSFPFGNAVKYNGTILNFTSTTFPTTQDEFGILNGYLVVNLSDTDSGWGESYTPSAAEIKVYFYGWRMNNGTFGTAYTGAAGDVKTWVPIGDSDLTRKTTTLPTADAPTIAEGKIDYYKLTYQLTQATEEVIEVEGSLDLIDGGNQLEVGEVVIVREKANPSVDNDGWVRINDSYATGNSSNYLKYRTDKVIAIYKNGEIDDLWIVNKATSTIYGNESYVIHASDYDSTAEYTVTYTALDTYKLSSAENNVEVTYNTNLKTVVDALVQRQEDDETDISILKIQMIQVLARLSAGGL